MLSRSYKLTNEKLRKNDGHVLIGWFLADVRNDRSNPLFIEVIVLGHPNSLSSEKNSANYYSSNESDNDRIKSLKFCRDYY